MAGRGGTGGVLDWALAAGGRRTQTPRYTLDVSRCAAPEPLVALVAQQLRAAVGGLRVDLEDRLSYVARVLAARVGEKTWRQYGSIFAQFVRFCIAEDLEFLPASQSTGLLWAQYLAAKGTVKATTAQPYFSAINTVHDLLQLPKPCEGNSVLTSFRRGWERMQVDLRAGPQLVLAFDAQVVWQLYEALPSAFTLEVLQPLLFTVLSFVLFLRPDSMLSIAWCSLFDHVLGPVFQYKPLNWKGHIVRPEEAPVLQFPLFGLPALKSAIALQMHLAGGALWSSPRKLGTPDGERWFAAALQRHGLASLLEIHSLYSLRRGGASAARAAGVPMEVIESYGGWAAGSSSLREHYLDFGVARSPAAERFFGPLSVGRVAPFAQQYFNR